MNINIEGVQWDELAATENTAGKKEAGPQNRPGLPGPAWGSISSLRDPKV